MPCNPLDISLPQPSGPGGIPIPGFGLPFALDLDDINPFPKGFPEDLMDLLNSLQLLLPSGPLKPGLSINAGKNVFDAILKLLDHLFPFLMLYKFFLPILNLLLCIIEVLCSLTNPYKLRKAIKRLFRNCLPAFLNLFPIFALIMMLISLLLLLLRLIKYLIDYIKRLIDLILQNIRAFRKAYVDADADTIVKIANKIGSLLCIFQNLFVLLSLFGSIIQIIRDMFLRSFALPPCDNSDDGCCSTDVCPEYVQAPFTRKTGTLKYLNKVTESNLIPGLPAGFGSLSVDIRPESLQLFDEDQTIKEAFKNIYDAYDVTVSPKPIFFPTDSNYTPTTDPKQAAYTVDLRMYYSPALWGRKGHARYIRFNNVVVQNVPTTSLKQYDNSVGYIANAIITPIGGKGFEDDGTTILHGYADDGKTEISSQATLENFIHKAPKIGSGIKLLEKDGYVFEDVEYTFKPNFEVLQSKQIVVLACEPSFDIDKDFINNIIAGDMGIKLALVNNLFENNFPDPLAAIECLQTAVDGLKTNLTVEGVAVFQATTTACLERLQDNTTSALGDLFGIAVDPCQSTFTLSPSLQFTTKPIIVSVTLNDKNKTSLNENLPDDVAATVASKLKGHATVGIVGGFTYANNQFTAELTSDLPGKGELMVSYDNNIFCTNNIPEDIDVTPTHDLQIVNYEFIYAPPSGMKDLVGTGDTSEGKPRRDEGDVARDNNG